jgi:flagellin
MALNIRANITSLRSLNHLGRTDTALATVLEQLSSGKRINRAADDPGGSVRAVRLESESIAVRQAIRSANDGITIVQTAEAASDEVTDLLTRMKELATESKTGTLTASERTVLNDEYVELRSEISRIAVSTEFNDISLADGTSATINVQVGINNSSNDQIAIDLGSLALGDLSLTSSTIGTGTTTSLAGSAIDAIDEALDTVSGYRASFGATQTRLDSAVSFATSLDENLQTALSNVLDADTARLTSETARLTLLGSAGVAALAQANNLNELVVSQLLLN